MGVPLLERSRELGGGTDRNLLPSGRGGRQWLLDCASLERVTEIAARVARCPQPAGAKEHPVVIRPVMDGGADL